MNRIDRTGNGKDNDSRPPDQEAAIVEVMEIDVEIEIEDQAEPLGFSVVIDERFEETVCARIGVTEDMHLFEHGHDEPLLHPPHGRKAIRLIGHRCTVVTVEVRYDHRTIEQRFAPAATVFKVLQWAVSKKGFDLDPVTAAKANLMLPGADAPLPRDSAVGKFVRPNHCTLVVDLTLNDFTNG